MDDTHFKDMFLQDIASLFVTWTQTRQILKDKSNREGPQSFVLEWAALVQCPLYFSVLVVFVSVMGVCPSVICVLVKRIVVQMQCRMQMPVNRKFPKSSDQNHPAGFSEPQLWQSPCWHHFDDTMAIPQLGTCNLISFFYLLQPRAFLCLQIIRKCISFSILSLQWRDLSLYG